MACATLPIRDCVMSSARAPALAVEGLTTEFRIEGRWHTAIRDVSFAVDRNETLALVGESGCGKSITALSIMGLVPKANGRISAGRVLLDGRDLTRFDETQMETVRGGAISMIFQEPMTSLNPVLPIGFQVAETLRYHTRMSSAEARSRALTLLEHVKIPSAARDRKSTRLNSSHRCISYAVFCLKKKKKT